jgi:hypothetical protein
VFVHISVVERAGLGGLDEGQRLAMKVVTTKRAARLPPLPCSTKRERSAKPACAPRRANGEGMPSGMQVAAFLRIHRDLFGWGRGGGRSEARNDAFRGTELSVPTGGFASFFRRPADRTSGSSRRC